jgi:hypothetical protein
MKLKQVISKWRYILFVAGLTVWICLQNSYPLISLASAIIGIVAIKGALNNAFKEI